ncbi:MAG: transcription termination/antitermination protein NusA [Zetaproteobacteria bacterium]|nr:MAG: transcription termination/antitermination protein NusA [Zetaproteobacteria bacterium]
MGVEMLHVADAVAREKMVDRELVFEAMEQALRTSARKSYGNKEVEAVIDRSNGEIFLFHVRTVVESVEDPENELTPDEAAAELGGDAEVEVGMQLRTPLPPITMGRVAAQAAKQVINQKLREAERMRVVEEYAPRVGELITGIVKRVERGNVYVDLGHGEGVMYREDQLPRESWRQGDRIRAYLREVRDQSKGPLIFLSRADAGMVLKLFEQEVPEIQEGIVTIEAIARDPGSRSKLAVSSSDPAIDPVGACVGMRGARVQAVVNELHGERMDIIECTDDIVAFVINALAPAEVERVLVDEERNTIEVAVTEENLALAIGRRGQNVRLASELTGWEIELMTTGDQARKRAEETEALLSTFVNGLDIEVDFAMMLVEEGFAGLDEIAFCADEELTAIEGIDTEMAQELKRRAREALLDQAAAAAEEAGERPLTGFPPLREEIAAQLVVLGITSLDRLADAGLDDLEVIEGLPVEEAEKLIIGAREACGWFDEEGG